ncbi:MAG: hypothetical protein V7709_19265 [Halioglobus sp.]
MKSPIRVYRLALVLMLGLGLSACAGKDKESETPEQLMDLFRQEILSTVGDADRAEQALALAEQLEQGFVATQSQLQVDMETVRSMNADFNATETQFQAFFEGLNAQAGTRQNQAVAIHSKMQALLTADEWKQLKHARNDALQTVLKLL